MKYKIALTLNKIILKVPFLSFNKKVTFYKIIKNYLKTNGYKGI